MSSNKFGSFKDFVNLSNYRKTNSIHFNFVMNLFTKGVSIVSGLLLYRISLKILEDSEYGVWLTFLSMFQWITFFEIGLGNGLKNKLAEALEKKDVKLGKILVSTTYFIIGIISFSLLIVFLASNYFLDWQHILNTDIPLKELTAVSNIIFSCFFIRFLLQIIINVTAAELNPAIGTALDPLSNVFVLVVIGIGSKFFQFNLMTFASVMSVIPLLVFLLASVILFSSKYKDVAPSYRHIDLKKAKSLIGLSINFFFVKIAGIMLYQVSSFVIAHYFGAKNVVQYSLSRKLFSTIAFLGSIIQNTVWPYLTRAWTANDKNRIRKVFGIQMSIWMLAVIISGGVLAAAPWIYNLWLDGEATVDFKMNFLQFFNYAIFSFGGIFSVIVNSTGKLRLQFVSALTGAALFIPVSHILIRQFGMGPEAVIVSTIICNFFGPVLAPIQCYKLYKGTAKGIWNK